MEWRIRKDARGGFSVERGLNHKGGEKIPGAMGATMPAFIVYESAHFDTDKQVKSFYEEETGRAHAGRRKLGRNGQPRRRTLRALRGRTDLRRSRRYARELPEMPPHNQLEYI